MRLNERRVFHDDWRARVSTRHDEIILSRVCMCVSVTSGTGFLDIYFRAHPKSALVTIFRLREKQ